MLVIILTIITVMVINLYKPYKVLETKKHIEKKMVKKEENLKTINKAIIPPEANNKKIIEKNKNSTVTLKTKKKQSKKIKEDNSKKVNSRYKDMFIKDKNNKDYPDETAVFKVNVDNIQKEISFSDKLKIITIVKGIPNKDFDKVYEYLQEKDAGEAIVKTFRLLKKSLNSEQYKRLQQVASKYIRMSTLNQYIEK